MRGCLVVLAVLVACGGDGKSSGTEDTDPSADTDTVPDDLDGACESDKFWTGGDRESPMMHPGMDCIACHADRHEGPTFAVAGTAYRDLDEPDDCNGVVRALIEIIDANGDITELESNEAGNFYLEERRSDIVFPITARVTKGDKVSEMLTPQDDGACNRCHSAEGAEAAPGRIYQP